MAQEAAKVLAISPAGEITVATIGKKVCHRCVNSGGCGISVLVKYFGTKQHQFTASSDVTVDVGDQVVLRIKNSSLLLAAVLMYLLPLATMLLAALAAQFLIHERGETAQILAALVGLMLGLCLSRFISQAGISARKFEPVITSRFNPVIEAGTIQQN